MANTVTVTIRALNETDKAFDSINEKLGKVFKDMAKMAATASPQLFGPLIAGAGATAAALASAGIASAAFGAAVVPQLSAVKKASESYTKVITAQDKAARMNADAHALAAKGGKDYTAALSKAKSANLAAKDAQDAYNQSLGKMPPATRATAEALAKLKDAGQKWSDALAPKTMPVFTKGLDTIRGLLPALTPLVDTASSAFSHMMDNIAKGIKGNAFKSFMDDMNGAAKKTLPDFISSLGNIGAGFAGILQAFAPFAGELTGGLERITARFKAWGQSLKGSTGFNTWMEGVKAKLPGLLSLFESLAQTAMKLSTAFMPVSSAVLTVVESLAKLVNVIPQGVWDWVVPVLASIALAMKAYAIATGIATAASIAFSAVLDANPIFLAVAGIAAATAGYFALKGSTDASTDSLNRNADAAKNVKSVWEGGSWTDNIAGGWNTVTDALSTAANAVFTLGGATDWVHKKLFGDDKWGPLADATNKAAAATNNFSDAALGAKQSVEEETAALFHSANAMLELSGSNIGLEAAFDNASKSIRQNGKNLDIHTAKGRANAQALNEVAVAAQAQYTATLKSGRGSVIAGQQMNSARASFIRLAMSMGDSRAQANALANSLGLIKSKTVTIVTIFKNIGTSNPGITSGTGHAAVATKASGGIVGYAASGGPRSNTTLVGENGPELVDLAPGSMVHSAGDTARLMKPPPHITDAVFNFSKSGGGSLGGGKTPALALKQLIDAIDEKITTIRSKFNAVISIIKQKFDGNQEDALVAYAKRNLAHLEELAKKRDAVAAKLADARKYAADLAKSARDFASLANLNSAQTPVGIKIGLEQKLGKMRQFASALKSLAKRGLSKILFQQISEAGPDAGLEMAQNFLAMDPGLFKQVNAIQGQISKAAGQIGSNTAEYLFGTKFLEKQEEHFQRAMDKAADKFADKIAAALSKLSKHKGKASGGPTGGLTWVGEQGAELIDLPYGSSVYSAGDSRRMTSGSSGVTKIQLEWVGTNAGDEFMVWLKRNIRATAGGGPNSVQIALS